MSSRRPLPHASNNYGHSPNHIPYSERIVCVILSSILLIYGILGWVIDDLYLPGKRSRGIHLHGGSLWIMLGAFVCAAANLLSVVVDHYDKRNNETNYKLFAQVTKISGWVLFGIALLADLFFFHKITR